MAMTKSSGGLSRFQKFETETIHRREIHGATYNPRFIDENAKARLVKGLKKHGLVETLVWNRRSGVLVGGHQRLAALDALEGTDDYELTVAVIDVDDREEKALNVQLNNPSMQGEWDLDRLAAMSTEFGLDMEQDLGFTEFDVSTLFGGDDRFTALFEDTSDVTAAKNTLEEIKRDRAAMTEKMKLEQSADFIFTVVCESQEDKDTMLRKMGVPITEVFVSSTAIRRLENARNSSV